ncbi:hypothetical protein BX666DRAFT_2027336 [Dichotomocladium elegans]|nr:hypothetical protein BX666DRAFT_2027336 [Dichotomocladium elegans]
MRTSLLLISTAVLFAIASNATPVQEGSNGDNDEQDGDKEGHDENDEQDGDREDKELGDDP